jgi:hypothetical protein
MGENLLSVGAEMFKINGLTLLEFDQLKHDWNKFCMRRPVVGLT